MREYPELRGRLTLRVHGAKALLVTHVPLRALTLIETRVIHSHSRLEPIVVRASRFLPKAKRPMPFLVDDSFQRVDLLQIARIVRHPRERAISSAYEKRHTCCGEKRDAEQANPAI